MNKQLKNKNTLNFSSLEEACKLLSKVDKVIFNKMINFPNGYI